MDAILNANQGDTINVYAGTYNENININKSINLISISGSASTIIISPNKDKHTIELTTDNITIQGFTIKNQATTYSCIKLNSANNCKISNNVIKYSGNGLYLIDSLKITIDNNNIENNNVGIYFSNADESIIKNNNIHDNNQNGIFVAYTSTNNTFYQNHFYKNDPNTFDIGTNNWDYNYKGNYWDDYNGYDNNSDGIGDNPYIIKGNDNNIDHFPLGYFLSLKPVAFIDSITPNPAKYKDTITFIGHGEGSIVSKEWKSNGVLINTSWNFSTSTLLIGTHNISFRVKDDKGEWSDYVYQNLVINPNIKPVAYISTPINLTYRYGELIKFYGYGIDSDGNIKAYLWRSVPTQIYSVENAFNKSDIPTGEYIIYFKVMDNKEDWSPEVSINLKILSNNSTMNLPPIANTGGPYYGYTNEQILFNGSKSYDPDQNDTLRYKWDFGDGEKGFGINTNHTYKSQGNYTIKLNVIDKYGLEDNSSTYVNITLKPKNEEDEKEIPGFEVLLFFIAIIFLVTRLKNCKSK